VYNGAFVYACWALYRSDFAWCGTTLTGSPLEIAIGLAQAKELGLIIGRHRSMIAHVRHHRRRQPCGRELLTW
jgi:hypothetical protein